MSFEMVANQYGKSEVRMTKVTRGEKEHTVRQITVYIQLRGDFAESYTKGDNRKVIATDSMKNTVYALGSQHPIDTIENFAVYLGGHFISQYPQVNETEIHIKQELWDRVPKKENGEPHPTAFVNRGPEKRETFVFTVRGQKPTIKSRVYGMQVLRTAGSEWSDFVADEYRTLGDTKDRLFGTIVDVWYHHKDGATDFDASYNNTRKALIDVFANHHSLGVQQTQLVMGEEVLKASPSITKVEIALPNKHHIPFDLKPLGRENKNEIFVATDEPFGFIKCTVARK